MIKYIHVYVLCTNFHYLVWGDWSETLNELHGNCYTYTGYTYSTYGFRHTGINKYNLKL